MSQVCGLWPDSAHNYLSAALPAATLSCTIIRHTVSSSSSSKNSPNFNRLSQGFAGFIWQTHLGRCLMTPNLNYHRLAIAIVWHWPWALQNNQIPRCGIKPGLFKTLTMLEELDWTLDCNCQGHLCPGLFTYCSAQLCCTDRQLTDKPDTAKFGLYPTLT